MDTAVRWDRKDALWLSACLAGVLAVCLCLAAFTGTDFLRRSLTDSYTLQALAWREGKVSLGQDYPWMELAVYEGDWYVSFGPVPTIPMLLLSFVFGPNTPNALADLIYFMGFAAAAYALLRRRIPKAQAAGTALFACAGGCVLDIAVSGSGFAGAVWYQAQLLALLLMMLSFLFLDDGPQKKASGPLAALLWALAVGCRPTYAVYAPFLAWQLWLRAGKPGWRKLLPALGPQLAPAVVVALVLAGYNLLRFGDPLEFGASYLPEFVNAGEPMLSFGRIPRNLGYDLRLPEIVGGRLVLPVVSGFAFYLTNPMFDFSLVRCAVCGVRRERSPALYILCLSVLVHALLLMTHRTNGGWQYGTRYLCDCLPALIALFGLSEKQLRRPEAALMGMLAVFNWAGILIFHA